MKGVTKLTGLYIICQSLLIAYKLWFNSLHPITWKAVFTPTLVLAIVTMVLIGIGTIIIGNHKKDKKLW